jgi:hypothetical protein
LLEVIVPKNCNVSISTEAARKNNHLESGTAFIISRDSHCNRDIKKTQSRLQEITIALNKG